jgi:hypothetical protein
LLSENETNEEVKSRIVDLPDTSFCTRSSESINRLPGKPGKRQGLLKAWLRSRPKGYMAPNSSRRRRLAGSGRSPTSMPRTTKPPSLLLLAYALKPWILARQAEDVVPQKLS